MPTLGLIGLVLLVLLLAGALAPRVFAASAPPKPATHAPSTEPVSAATPPLSAKELDERLSRLSKSEPPAHLAPAAMCYKVAAPPQTADYVCPVDGSRTQYARESGMVDLVHGLAGMRLAVKKLPGLDAALDEKAMCRKCAPQGHGGIALVVQHPDGRAVRTEAVSGADLQLLREFLTGSLTHGGRHGQEAPLKDHLPRIRALLGLTEK